MLDALAAAGRTDAGTVRDIGWVHTGVAVPQGAAAPAVADAAALRALLQRARASTCLIPNGPRRASTR